MAAVQQAVGHGRFDLGCWLVVAIQPYFNRRRDSHSWIRMHLIGLEAARTAQDVQAEAELHRGLGGAYYYSGQYEKSYHHQRTALDCYRRLGWEGEILLVNLGSAAAALGRYDESFEYLHKALATSRETGYRNVEGYALQSLGATHQRVGQYEEATDCCRQAVQVFQATGDQFGLNIALCRMAYSYLRRRMLQQATDHLQQALQHARSIDDWPGEAWILETLGGAAHEAGRQDTAREFWQASLAVYERLLDAESIAYVRARLANIARTPITPRPRP
ncbi:tetratricopeptide repeat protein [Nonomuraea sp. NPDC002799]